MSHPMSDFTAPAKRVEESLELLAILSDVLKHNGAFKDGSPGEHPAMLSSHGEDGIVRSMRVIAWAAHRDFCKLATDLGIPE